MPGGVRAVPTCPASGGKIPTLLAGQLRELRDAYEQAADIAAYEQKLAEFRRRYSNRPAMLRRIEKL